eukprot:10821390-Alexandrium_andersonii.AAC.1
MSASLVGSEMCIRDRSGKVGGRIRDRIDHLGAGVAPPDGGHAAPLARPVSYTHLTLPTICSV